MGYIDSELGIKTAKGLAKYFTTLFGQEIMAIKVANSVRLIWAVDNKLHTHDIKASVIYVIQEEQLDVAMKEIKDSITAKIKTPTTLETALKIKREGTNMRHQHVLNCLELELLDAKDGDEIKVIVQENKAEIWNGNIYTGRHLFK